jgi:molybdopterin/thiamine biosynthesis adenylyltransferase
MSTNDPQQQQMIRDAMKAIAERKPGRSKLVYDKTKRTIVAVAEGAQTARALNITAEDADMFAVVTLSSRWLREHWKELSAAGAVTTSFNSWDGEDALTQRDLGGQPAPTVVTGTISLGRGEKTGANGPLTIVLSASVAAPGVSTFASPDGAPYTAVARSSQGGQHDDNVVLFADVEPELATRRKGILETTVLKDSSVLVVGLGTGGAHAAVELAKCGVGRFAIVDRDRLSVGNVVRHPGGISQVGRLKVNVVRDLLLETNPDAEVKTLPLDVNFENVEQLKPLIAKADVVICGTDNRQSKLLINRLCVEANVPAVYGGAFRRAYGGQILRVRPRKSPCHQCFISEMPDEAADVEVSSAADAEGIAYSDRPVAVEPGLSLDVLPIANMVAKLALLELMANKPTTLKALEKDYDAPWYLWLNRPEPGTPYASMPPLSESSDEMTINRWYGIYFDRDAGCSVCGDFLSSVAASYGLDLAAASPLPSAPAKE